MRMSRLGNTPFIWSLLLNACLVIWPFESIFRTSLVLMPLFKVSDFRSCSGCLHWMVKAPPTRVHTTAFFSAHIDNTGCVFISLHSFLRTSWHTHISGTHFERFYTCYQSYLGYSGLCRRDKGTVWALAGKQSCWQQQVHSCSNPAGGNVCLCFHHTTRLLTAAGVSVRVRVRVSETWARRDLSFNCELKSAFMFVEKDRGSTF